MGARRTFYAFLCVTTLYIIFEDDVKRAALPPSFDLPLEIIIACILVCIIVEIGEAARELNGSPACPQRPPST